MLVRTESLATATLATYQPSTKALCVGDDDDDDNGTVRDEGTDDDAHCIDMALEPLLPESGTTRGGDPAKRIPELTNGGISRLTHSLAVVLLLVTVPPLGTKLDGGVAVVVVDSPSGMQTASTTTMGTFASLAAVADDFIVIVYETNKNVRLLYGTVRYGDEKWIVGRVSASRRVSWVADI